MPGQAIQVGPFIGGLNTFSDPSAIADNELSICENFELDLDGSLKSRPPIEELAVSFPLAVSGGNINILDYFYEATGQSYLLASDGVSSTYFFDGTSWTLVTDQLAAAGFAQFDDKAWLTARVGSAQDGGYWTPSGGFTVDADMPKGEVIVVFKDRMWISEGRTSTNQGTRLYRSRTLADPALWPTVTDFVDIGSGDGQNIVNLAVYFNTLLIFRTNSIFGLQYATDPAAAVVALVVPNVGLASKDALDAFESFIYFIYEDKAYEFSNNKAAQINVKVPFRAGSKAGIYLPFAVSEFNRRVIFTYYGTLFVYSLRTRTWTTWKSDTFGAVGKIVKQETAGDEAVAITHKSAGIPVTGSARVTPTLKITDIVSNVAEQMMCIAQTKIFNYQAGSIYKRLFWWGIDANFKTTVDGLAFPITFNFDTKWGDLLSKTWNDLLPFFWAAPLETPPFVESDVDVSTAPLGRKFVKFFKSLRFRQIFYRVNFPTDGSSATAPVRLFSLMTYVNPKETVSRTIN
jgi:SAM-dependent methyltransferase